MPTISEDSNLFTMIVVFTVKPEQQQELVDAIIGEVERWVRYLPGFVSSNFHLSQDGTRVLNYAQWTTKEAWQAFTQDSESDVLSSKVKRSSVASSDYPVNVNCTSPVGSGKSWWWM